MHGSAVKLQFISLTILFLTLTQIITLSINQSEIVKVAPTNVNFCWVN